jgi:hypothetical protein
MRFLNHLIAVACLTATGPCFALPRCEDVQTGAKQKLNALLELQSAHEDNKKELIQIDVEALNVLSQIKNNR